jgi:hypothetical protein
VCLRASKVQAFRTSNNNFSPLSTNCNHFSISPSGLGVAPFSLHPAILYSAVTDGCHYCCAHKEAGTSREKIVAYLFFIFIFYIFIASGLKAQNFFIPTW